jgi:hypothetical protein
LSAFTLEDVQVTEERLRGCRVYADERAIEREGERRERGRESGRKTGLARRIAVHDQHLVRKAVRLGEERYTLAFSVARQQVKRHTYTYPETLCGLQFPALCAGGRLE